MVNLVKFAFQVQKYEEKEKEWTSLKEISESKNQDSSMLLEQQKEYESQIASMEKEILVSALF